ncbi:MAG TPA: hypothetical protein DEP28_10010 [Bacteroidetes bacterium]|nr:hypothetical protein [Bacteroidota bacterium]
MEIKDFKHSIQLRVRSFEVDSQGIVHNAVYLQYFETGRIEYRRNFGIHLRPDGVFSDGMKVVVARNEIDYFIPSYLDELLDVHTKISWIKNSSFCFEQLIIKNLNKQTICQCSGILVNLNSKTNTPEKIDSKFINEVKNFEKELILKT